MCDRLQNAWRYTNREVWRPLFKRFERHHPDLPIAVARSMLVRENMKPIFIPTGANPALDAIRRDVDTYLDLAQDAQTAINRIKPSFFLGGRAVATLLSDIAVAFRDYDSPALDQAYWQRLGLFLERHALPYRLDTDPLKLTPLLTNEIDQLYRNLRSRVSETTGMREALMAFEDAWDRQSSDWSQISAKNAIRYAALLAKNILVAASNGRDNDFAKALSRMRIESRFPSNDFANIFDKAYNFVNNYPNIRHSGDPTCQKRDLRPEDTMLAALLFVGLSACAHDLQMDLGS